jgi:hypothetical protein
MPAEEEDGDRGEEETEELKEPPLTLRELELPLRSTSDTTYAAQ